MGKATTAKREKLIQLIQDSLLSTTEASELLGISVAGLKKLTRFQTVVRGFYLKQDIEAYLNDEELQRQRKKHRGELIGGKDLKRDRQEARKEVRKQKGKNQLEIIADGILGRSK